MAGRVSGRGLHAACRPAMLGTSPKRTSCSHTVGHTRAHVHTYPPERDSLVSVSTTASGKAILVLFLAVLQRDMAVMHAGPGRHQVQGAVLSVLCKESPEQRLWAAGSPAGPLPPHLRHRCSCLSFHCFLLFYKNARKTETPKEPPVGREPLGPARGCRAPAGLPASAPGFGA